MLDKIIAYSVEIRLNIHGPLRSEGTPTTSLSHLLSVKNENHLQFSVPTGSVFSSLAILLAIPPRRLVIFDEPISLAISTIPAPI
jgi:hypothetical protein